MNRKRNGSPYGSQLVVVVIALLALAAWSGAKNIRALFRSEEHAESAPRAEAVANPAKGGDEKQGRTKRAASFANFRDGKIVQGTGIVKTVLGDDTSGLRHQKFILSDSGGRTVLVAHNIDLAPRIPDLKVGDAVDFCGEYRSNAQGGVVHWTHRDPKRRHRGGWLRRNGKVYQ